MCKSEDCLKGLKLVKFTKISCDDFLMMGLRYQHIAPPSPDIDYIAIRLDLKDIRSGSIYKVSGSVLFDLIFKVKLLPMFYRHTFVTMVLRSLFIP